MLRSSVPESFAKIRVPQNCPSARQLSLWMVASWRYVCLLYDLTRGFTCGLNNFQTRRGRLYCYERKPKPWIRPSRDSFIYVRELDTLLLLIVNIQRGVTSGCGVTQTMPYFAPTLPPGIFPNRIILSSEIRPCACCCSNKSRHLLPSHRTIEMGIIWEVFVYFLPLVFPLPVPALLGWTNDVDRNLTIMHQHSFSYGKSRSGRTEIQGKRVKSQT